MFEQLLSLQQTILEDEIFYPWFIPSQFTLYWLHWQSWRNNRRCIIEQSARCNVVDWIRVDDIRLVMCEPLEKIPTALTSQPPRYETIAGTMFPTRSGWWTHSGIGSSLEQLESVLERLPLRKPYSRTTVLRDTRSRTAKERMAITNIIELLYIPHPKLSMAPILSIHLANAALKRRALIFMKIEPHDPC